MKNHRALWAIALAAAALALGAFAYRQSGPGRDATARREARSERDRLASELIVQLDKDPRVRLADTRVAVERLAAYCANPKLASAETWYAEGLRAFYGASDTAAAGAAFARSAELRPEWAWPVNGLGIVEFTAGRRDEAERLFQRALELDPGWSRPHADQAILLRRAGELAAAFDHARRALAIEPNHPVNHFNYGVMLDELGRHAEARAEYERVLRDAPDMPQAAYNLACGYAREGDIDAAMPYLVQAIARDAAFGDYAKEDPDFDLIRDSSAFKRVIAREQP